MKKNKFKIYSLLYIDLKKNQKNTNLNSKIENQLDIYISCGCLLAASCKFFNIPYAIITNEPDFVKNRSISLGGEVEVLNGNFNRDVPNDASFHSAHYKLDILKDFGNGLYGSNVGLIDLDVVLTKPIDLVNFFDNDKTLCIYDISNEERSSYGDTIISKSLSSIGVNTKIPRWYGGEFIFGSAKSFSKLTSEIDLVWPLYEQKYRSLHHMGDEMVVTAALTKLKDNGMKLINAGNAIKPESYPLISRWWSSRTLCRQTSFKHATQAAFLHLPADKPFLAKMARENFDPDKFITAYHNYAKSRLLYRKIFNSLLNLRDGRKHFVGRL
ncbi:hypothetical protein [Malikia spinosa]|uniref:hypothetical protein n=1 Tax=Malikia spinosa TaxID=86180 RepID=UPI003FA29FD9